jgi:hypothetical protein
VFSFLGGFCGGGKVAPACCYLGVVRWGVAADRGVAMGGGFFGEGIEADGLGDFVANILILIINLMLLLRGLE